MREGDPAESTGSPLNAGRGSVTDASMKKRKKKRSHSHDEGSYVCPTCGERIVVPLDPTGGADQQYVEDCPVCCNPNVIRLEYFGAGESPRVSAGAE